MQEVELLKEQVGKYKFEICLKSFFETFSSGEFPQFNTILWCTGWVEQKIKQTMFQTVSRFENCSSCNKGKDMVQNV